MGRPKSGQLKVVRRGAAILLLLLTVGANGQRFGWVSDTLILLTILGLATGAMFIWLQLRSPSPLLDFSLFRNAQFSSAVMVGFVFGIGNFASNYIVPVFVQQVQHFTPGLSGLLLVPAGILVISTTPLFARLAADTQAAFAPLRRSRPRDSAETAFRSDRPSSSSSGRP